MRAGTFVPVFVTSATKSIGIDPLLDTIAELFPSPVDRGKAPAEPEPLAPDPGAPLCENGSRRRHPRRDHGRATTAFFTGFVPQGVPGRKSVPYRPGLA